jgi:hypothetical protein
MKSSILRLLSLTPLFVLPACAPPDGDDPDLSAPQALDPQALTLPGGAIGAVPSPVGTVSTLPVPRITGVGAGSPVVGFSATLGVLGTNLSQASWDFGDNAIPRTATGLSTRVVFRRPGIVPVRVTGRSAVGLTVTRSFDVSVADVSVRSREPGASFPFHNGAGLQFEARPDGKKVFVQVPRRLADGTRPAQLGVERSDGTFALTSVLPSGMTEVVDVRLAVGTDGVARMLVADRSSLAFCRAPTTGVTCVALGAYRYSEGYSLALRSDNRPVVSVARDAWIAPSTGGLRLLSASTNTPTSLADFGDEIVVDAREYRLPVDIGSSHVLTLVGDRPVIVGNNGLFVGRYLDGTTIFPVQAYEATVPVPRSAADFAIRNVDSSTGRVQSAMARIINGRLVVAGVVSGRFVAYHAAAGALGSGFTRIDGDAVAGVDASSQPYRVGLSSVDGRPLFSFPNAAGQLSVVLSATPAPSERAELITLPGFSRGARYYTGVLGVGAGPSGIHALLVRDYLHLELLQGG